MIFYNFFKNGKMTKKQHGGKRPGAGRKVGPEGPTMTIAASVPGGLVAQLDELAEKRGWNRSEAIAEAIRRITSSQRKAGESNPTSEAGA